MLPDFIVPDVDAELQKVDEQKQKNVDMFNTPVNEPRLPVDEIPQDEETPAEGGPVVE
jgi:hypothetical protein